MDTSKTVSAGCCGDEHCNTGRRNRYFPRKQITADTYELEQSYQQQRRHLLNRAIHGWGVVYGYGVEPQPDEGCGDNAHYLEIKSGLALDACGRELVWLGTECAESHRVDLADVLALDADNKLLNEPGKSGRSQNDPDPWAEGDANSWWLLRVHYAERLISPVSIKDPCQCDNHEWDQVCDTVRFSLQFIDCSKCCEVTGCELHCRCTQSSCCARDPKKPAGRGGCRCLCDYLTELDPNPECCGLAQVSRTLKVDLLHGVPLACVKLVKDDCGDWTFGDSVEACGPRRLVKRNDLLFDLIRGCDLTRIRAVSWEPWHRERVSFADFKKSFGPEDGSANDGKGARLTTFSVQFSKPVQIATIRPDCFAMTVIARDDEDAWGRTLRVPIVNVRIDDSDPKDKDLAMGATLMVDSDWAQGALDDVSVFAKHVTRVEILVRGDYLLDCNGIPVDANARGASAAPTGNGVPGDTYISTFIVEEMRPDDYETKSTYREF
jgi:hypothetical protein